MRKLIASLVFVGLALTSVPAQSQSLFVGSWNSAPNGAVAEYGLDGSLIGTFVSGLNYPSGLAFDRSGNLYVQTYDGTISKFDSSGTPINAAFATIPVGAGHAMGMITFDSSGNLWVPNSVDNTVLEINSDGDVIKTMTGFTSPSAVAFDSGGNLWVANRLGNNLLEYDADGLLINTLTGVNGPDGGPTSIAFDSSGNLFASTYGVEGEILKYDPSGTFLGTFASFTANASLDYVTDMIFDDSGNLWITDLGSSRIQEYNSTGNLIDTIGFRSPSGIAIMPVPEPSAVALAGLGGIMLLAFRRPLRRD